MNFKRLLDRGVQREIRGIVFDGDRCPVCSKLWPVMVGSKQIGGVTSAVWSPRLKRNIGLSMIDRDYWKAGQVVTVHSEDGEVRPGEVFNVAILLVSCRLVVYFEYTSIRLER